MYNLSIKLYISQMYFLDALFGKSIYVMDGILHAKYLLVPLANIFYMLLTGKTLLNLFMQCIFRQA